MMQFLTLRRLTKLRLVTYEDFIMRDVNLIYATNQAETTVGDHASTNVLALNSANEDPGAMDMDYRVIATVGTTALASSGSATVQAVLQDCDTAGGTYVDVVAGKVFGYASTAVGTELLNIKMPLGIRQYRRIAWRIGGAALTAGTFSAWEKVGKQRNIARPDAL